MRAVIIIPEAKIDTEGPADKIQVVLSAAPDCEPMVIVKIGDNLHMEFSPDEALDFSSDIIKCCMDSEKLTEGSSPRANPTATEEEGA